MTPAGHQSRTNHPSSSFYSDSGSICQNRKGCKIGRTRQAASRRDAPIMRYVYNLVLVADITAAQRVITELILNTGNSSAMATVPMILPKTNIITGSIKEVTVLMEASSCLP